MSGGTGNPLLALYYSKLGSQKEPLNKTVLFEGEYRDRVGPFFPFRGPRLAVWLIDQP